MGPIRYFALIFPFLEKKIQIDIICSKEFNIFPIPEITLESIDNLNQYSLIIVAAGWGSISDKEILKKALSMKIPTCAIVDHWSWYKERFQLKNDLILPDYILLNDDYSKSECIALGFKKEQLFALGNPVLEHRWDKNELINNFKTTEKNNTILFISECYKKSFPKGSIHDNGFDEFEVLDKILSSKKDDDVVLVKLHPKETPEKYSNYANVITIIDRFENVDAHLLNSNFVVGMGSILLIEASLVRSDIISFRPNQKIEFVGNKMGITKLIESEDLLKKVFLHQVNIKNDLNYFDFKGSTERITKFLAGIVNDER